MYIEKIEELKTNLYDKTQENIRYVEEIKNLKIQNEFLQKKLSVPEILRLEEQRRLPDLQNMDAEYF